MDPSTRQRAQVPGLDALVAHVEAAYADQLAKAAALIGGGVIDFESLSEFYRPGACPEPKP